MILSNAEESFYKVRNAPQVVRLSRRASSSALSPCNWDLYCCVIPTTGGEMTFCANIGECIHSVQWCVHLFL